MNKGTVCFVIFCVCVFVYFEYTISSYCSCMYEKFTDSSYKNVKTKTKCQTKCDDAGEECQAFSYNTKTKKCSLITDMTVNTDAVYSPNTTTYYLKTNVPDIPVKKFSTQPRTSYDDVGLIGSFSNTSLSTCKNTCQMLPECEAYIFDLDGKTCSLHDSLGTKIESDTSKTFATKTIKYISASLSSASSTTSASLVQNTDITQILLTASSSSLTQVAGTNVSSSLVQPLLQPLVQTSTTQQDVVARQYETLYSIVYVTMLQARYIRLTQPSETSSMFIGHIQVYSSHDNMLSGNGYLNTNSTTNASFVSTPQCCGDYAALYGTSTTNTYFGTTAQKNQIVQVDLGVMSPVYSVVISARPDCCSYSLLGCTLQLIDDKSIIVWESAPFQDVHSNTLTSVYDGVTVHDGYNMYTVYPPNTTSIGLLPTVGV